MSRSTASHPRVPVNRIAVDEQDSAPESLATAREQGYFGGVLPSEATGALAHPPPYQARA